MYVTLVNVHVKPEHVDDFIAATRRNHSGSIQEPGNLRFDVLQVAGDTTRFVLYEAYASEEDADAHKNTSHYKKWRDTVKDWMASPRVKVLYNGLFPQIDRDGN
jgi:autoinducer 2-degrading protein